MTTPKHCVFIPFFLVCFIKAEHPPNVRNSAKWQRLPQMAENPPMAEGPPNGRTPTNGRRSTKWQNTHQMAEHPPNGRTPTKWQNIHQMAEHLPNGRTSTKWQNTYQMAEHPPNGRAPTKWQNIYHAAVTFYNALHNDYQFLCLLVLIITLQRHLCVQKFINQLLFFFV